jgi:hypothetical protein
MRQQRMYLFATLAAVAAVAASAPLLCLLGAGFGSITWPQVDPGAGASELIAVPGRVATGRSAPATRRERIEGAPVPGRDPRAGARTTGIAWPLQRATTRTSSHRRPRVMKAPDSVARVVSTPAPPAAVASAPVESLPTTVQQVQKRRNPKSRTSRTKAHKPQRTTSRRPLTPAVGEEKWHKNDRPTERPGFTPSRREVPQTASPCAECARRSCRSEHGNSRKGTGGSQGDCHGRSH